MLVSVHISFLNNGSIEPAFSLCYYCVVVFCCVISFIVMVQCDSMCMLSDISVHAMFMY